MPQKILFLFFFVADVLSMINYAIMNAFTCIYDQIHTITSDLVEREGVWMCVKECFLEIATLRRSDRLLATTMDILTNKGCPAFGGSSATVHTASSRNIKEAKLFSLFRLFIQSGL